MTKSIMAILLAAAAAAAAPAALAADIRVDVPVQAEVRGEEVVLGEIAYISGPECALKNDLAGVHITRAPNPGRESTIRRAYLEHRIRSAGLPEDQFELKIPERVRVTRASQELDEGWVRGIVLDHLAETEPYRSNKWELVSLRCGRLPVLPAGEIDYRVMPGRSSNPARLRLRIYVFVDGAEEARLNTSARVDMTARVAVASRLLDAGGAIGPQDVRMAEVSVTRLPKDVLTAPDQAVGMVPRRRIAAGKPLEASDLEQEMLVEKGDMVTLVAESGTLRVTSPGQARRDGVEGEEVPVLNLSSKKTVVGRVVDSRTIAVNF